MATLSLAIQSKQAQTALAQLSTQMGITIGTVNRLNLSMGSLDRKLIGSSSYLAAFTTRFLAFGAAFAALRGIKASIDTIREMDEALIRLRGHLIDPRVPVQEQIRSFNELKDVAFEMGNATRFSAIQATEGLTTLVKAGFSAKDVMVALAPIMKFASVGMIGMEQAVKSVTDALVQFSLGIDQTERVTDVFALAAGLSKTNIGEITEAFQKAGPIFSAAGNQIEEVAALLVVLADAGRVGESAGTALRSTLITMIRPTQEQRRVLEELIENVDEASPITHKFVDVLKAYNKVQIDIGKAPFLFERRNVVDVINMLKSTTKIEEFISLLKNAGGTVREFSGMLDESINAKLNKLSSTFQQIAVDTGEAGLIGAIKDLLTVINAGIRALAGWGQEWEKISTTLNRVRYRLMPGTAILKDVTSTHIEEAARFGKFLVDFFSSHDVRETKKLWVDYWNDVNEISKRGADRIRIGLGILKPYVDQGPPLPENYVAPSVPYPPDFVGPLQIEEPYRPKTRQQEAAEFRIQDLISRKQAELNVIKLVNNAREVELELYDVKRIAAQNDAIITQEQIDKYTELLRLVNIGNKQREIADIAKRTRKEIDVLSLSNNEREKQLQLYDLTRDLSDKEKIAVDAEVKALGKLISTLQTLNKQREIENIAKRIRKEIDVLSLSNNEREKQLQLYDLTRDLSDKEKIAVDAEVKALGKLISTLQTLNKLRQTADEIGNAFTDALDKLIFQTAKLKDILRDLLRSLSTAVIRKAVTEPAGQLVANLVTQIGTSIFSGGVGDEADGVATIDTGSGPRPVKYQYGSIISEPTSLYSASGKRGMMSETETEGILPLARDSSGRLGVHTSGGGASIINIYVNTPDANSFRRSKRQIVSSLRRISAGRE